MIYCPRCDSILLHRSRHVRAKDLLMLLIGRRPLRCGECHRRFYAPIWRHRCDPAVAREWGRVYVPEEERRAS